MVNILVIDDDECIHESFKIVLEPEHSIDVASSGEEGVAKATTNPPDIIFLDLRMPGIGGVEALRQLQVICPDIPTLIMTAFFEEHMLKLEKARDDGCLFELCRKPMDNKQIKLVVHAYGNSLEPEKGSAKQDYERHFFQLYLAGDASGYSKIIEGLRDALDNNLNCYDLEVINLMKNPELAERDNIIATPSVVRGNRGEPLMVIGDMSNSESVLSGLGLIQNAELGED
ncbi:MAG: response regulator [Candidatus Anammoxibacter sp.]